MVLFLLRPGTLVATAQTQPRQQPVGRVDLSLGQVLKQFQQELEAIIDKAKNAADFIVVDAAGQVTLIVQMAQTEFQNDLDLFQARWTAVEANAIASLSSTIVILEKRAFKDAHEIADIVQITANTVPFSNKFPQVRSIGPDAIANYQDPVLVQAFGNFVDSGRKGYMPSIIIGNQPVPANLGINYTTKLAFMVPQKLFPHSSGLSYSQVRIVVPYHRCSFLWFNCRKEATFSTVVTSLPPSPGTITFKTDYETASVCPFRSAFSREGKIAIYFESGSYARHFGESLWQTFRTGQNIVF